MFEKRFVRWLVGGLLGCFAGISLVASVLPVALEIAGYGDRTALTAFLLRMAPLTALVWAAGGMLVTRTRRIRSAAALLGSVGLLSGALVVIAALAPSPRLVLVGAAAGWIYGFAGGLILGRIVAPPPADPDD